MYFKIKSCLKKRVGQQLWDMKCRVYKKVIEIFYFKTYSINSRLIMVLCRISEYKRSSAIKYSTNKYDRNECSKDMFITVIK